MRIMLVAPRSISRHAYNQAPFRFDYAFWNFFLPLCSLGNEVKFFDTSMFSSHEFDKDFENFQPDLLFCVMTGDKSVCPDEPWNSIIKITKNGTCKTFNWYCDDTWRFDDFSSKTCNNFHFCVTTESSFIKKYKEIGYDGVRYANWHSNPDAYSTVNCQKQSLLGFIGNLNGDRQKYLTHLAANGFSVSTIKNASFEDMIHLYSSSLIGLNFTKSASDGKRQMKARIFEIPATKTMLLSEHVDGIEEFFDLGKEIFVFNDEIELLDKISWASKNPEKAFEIAIAGHNRFLRDHTSQIRISKLLGSLS